VSDKEQFDFWYAVQNTDIVEMPEKRLETFGETHVSYHLLSELMDDVNRIRVREGRIQAFRPEIVTPDHFSDLDLQGFSGPTEAYARYLQEHQQDLLLIKYGFAVRNRPGQEQVLSGSLAEITERVREAVRHSDAPSSAVVVGVEEPWQVCLLKLIVEVVQASAPENIRDLRRTLRAPTADTGPDRRVEIEEEFRLAEINPGRINHLGALLERYGLFEEYQDRFFALIRS
jgi:hypothetical protein